LRAADESLGKALIEAKRAREVLERVRDFISVGRLQLAPVDIGEISRKIAEAWRSEAAEGGVSREA
jgi:hypothetical protein